VPDKSSVSYTIFIPDFKETGNLQRISSGLVNFQGASDVSSFRPERRFEPESSL
jgi:hypothetical protein